MITENSLSLVHCSKCDLSKRIEYPMHSPQSLNQILSHILSAYDPAVSKSERKHIVEQTIQSRGSSSCSLGETSVDAVRDLISAVKESVFDLLFQNNLSQIEASAILLMDRMNVRCLDSKELVSDLYCAARNAFPDFIWINEVAFRSWATQIMRRTLIRNISQQAAMGSASHQTEQLENKTQAGKTASQHLCLNETLEELEEAIQSLSPTEQQVLRYRYVDCFSAVETAERLRLSEANVRQIAKRARMKVSSILPTDDSSF